MDSQAVEYITWKNELFSRDLRTGETVFHDIVRAGDIDNMLSILPHFNGIEKSILKIRDYRGKTCLHLAAHLQDPSLAMNWIELLMKLGADINQGDGCSGSTILHHAVTSRNYKLTEWLTKRQDIDLNAKTCGGFTAFQLAYKIDDQKMMQTLARQGACCEEPESSDSGCNSDSSDNEEP